MAFPIRAQMVNVRTCNAKTNKNFPAWQVAREWIEVFQRSGLFGGGWYEFTWNWKIRKKFKSEIRDDCLLWNIRQNDLCDKFIPLNSFVDIHIKGLRFFLQWSRVVNRINCSHFCKLCVCVRLLLFSHSVMSDSLRPHGLQHARLPCPLPTSGGHSWGTVMAVNCNSGSECPNWWPSLGYTSHQNPEAGIYPNTTPKGYTPSLVADGPGCVCSWSRMIVQMGGCSTAQAPSGWPCVPGILPTTRERWWYGLSVSPAGLRASHAPGPLCEAVSSTASMEHLLCTHHSPAS